ncbi:hypothetical protein LY78DRAFT_182559 [Colletotrichum sublineola]|nr:hypothetical protein LY78DRAFT_182559 [Colletotrichum sublineola]
MRARAHHAPGVPFKSDQVLCPAFAYPDSVLPPPPPPPQKEVVYYRDEPHPPFYPFALFFLPFLVFIFVPSLPHRLPHLPTTLKRLPPPISCFRTTYREHRAPPNIPSHSRLTNRTPSPSQTSSHPPPATPST